MVLSFRGDRLNLRAIHEAIRELSRRINEGSWQNVTSAEVLAGDADDKP